MSKDVRLGHVFCPFHGKLFQGSIIFKGRDSMKSSISIVSWQTVLSWNILFYLEIASKHKYQRSNNLPVTTIVRNEITSEKIKRIVDEADDILLVFIINFVIDVLFVVVYVIVVTAEIMTRDAGDLDVMRVFFFSCHLWSKWLHKKSMKNVVQDKKWDMSLLFSLNSFHTIFEGKVFVILFLLQVLDVNLKGLPSDHFWRWIKRRDKWT